VSQNVYPLPVQSGVMTGTAFAPSGLAGATASSRYVGATLTGSPASGAFVVGDFVIAQDGVIWVNVEAGSPGTWVAVNTNATADTLYWMTVSA